MEGHWARPSHNAKPASASSGTALNKTVQMAPSSPVRALVCRIQSSFCFVSVYGAPALWEAPRVLTKNDPKEEGV